METVKIEVGRVAEVVVEGDTLRPKTHVDGMLLGGWGVGYSPDNAAEVTGGEPEGGRRWLDHNGHEVVPG